MFSKMFGSKVKDKIDDLEYKSFQVDDAFTQQILFGGSVTASRSAQFYRESSAVAVAVDTIASEMENILPVVSMADGTLSDQHPVIELLKRPNEFEDYREFIGRLSRFYLLNHDAFTYLEGMSTRPPRNLFAIANQNTTVTANGVDGYPNNISVNTGFGIGNYRRCLLYTSDAADE